MSHVSVPSLSAVDRFEVGDWVAGALLVALLAAYPFHRLASYWFPFNYSRGDPIVAVILVLWVVGVLGHRVVPKYSRLVLVLLGVCLLTVLYAHAIGPAYVSWWTGVVEVLKLAGAIAWGAAIFAVAYGRSRSIVPVALAVSVAIAAWFAGEAIHATIWLGEGRQTGPFHNANIFGNYLLLNAFLALALVESWIGERWPPIGVLAAATIPVLGLGLVVTASRGAMVGVLAGVVGALVLSERIRWWLVGTATIVAAAVLRYVADTVENRTSFLLGRYFSEKNLGGRWELWDLALTAFRENPLLGIGFGQYRELALVEIGRNISAHSSLLTVAAETGLVGLAAFVLVLGAVVLAGADCTGVVPEATYPAAFVVATAGQGLVADVHTFRALWIAIGLVAVLHADRFGTGRELRELLPSRLTGAVAD